MSCTSSAEDTAAMDGTVYLWPEGNMPDRTHPASSSYDPVDFRPNIEVFTVNESVTPKGAVLICPGGAFMFRSSIRSMAPAVTRCRKESILLTGKR